MSEEEKITLSVITRLINENRFYWKNDALDKIKEFLNNNEKPIKISKIKDDEIDPNFQTNT